MSIEERGIEERRAQGLGEVPRQISGENAALYSHTGRALLSGSSALDIARSPGVNRSTPVITENAKKEFNVQSVFAVRPLNSSDAIFCDTLEARKTATSGNLAIGEISFTAPTGKVLVINGMIANPSRQFMTVDTNGTSVDKTTFDFVINGAGVPQMTRLELTLNEDKSFPLYFIVPEKAILTLKAEQTVPGAVAVGEGINFGIELFVTMLLSTGLPPEQEIATRKIT